MKIDIKKYEKSIPECCEKTTLQQHADMLWCWGLMVAIEEKRLMDCGKCEFATKKKAGNK
jgi:ribosomal protein S27AE